MKLSKKNINKRKKFIKKVHLTKKKHKLIKNKNNTRTKSKMKRRKLTKNNKNIFKGGNKEMEQLFIDIVTDIGNNKIDDIISKLDNNPGLINYQIGENETCLLQQAILLKKPHIVELFIEKGAYINKIIRQIAPLGVAALYNCIECAELLLLHGADVNIKDIFGRTPLSIASLKNHIDILNLLLEYKANIESEDNDEKTALMYAVAGGFEDCVSILLDNGANIEAKDLFDWSPLFYGIEYGAPIEITDLLLKRGAKVNIFSILNNTPLHIACKRRNINFVKKLFEYGAKNTINTQDKYGTTALMFASANNNFDVVNFLLDNGADPLLKDTFGKTALRYSKDSKIQDFLKIKMKEQIEQNLKDQKTKQEELNKNIGEKEEIINKLKEQNSEIIAKNLIEEEEQRIANENLLKQEKETKKKELKDKKIQQKILKDQLKKQQLEAEESKKQEESKKTRGIIEKSASENLEIQLANENRLQEEEDRLFQIEIDKAIEQSLKTYNSENEKRLILDFWTKYFDNNEENILKLKKIIPTLMTQQNAFNLLISIIPAYTNKYYKNNPNINNILSLLFILIGIVSYQLHKNGIYLLLKGGSAIQNVSSQIPNESYLSNDIDLVIIHNNLEESRIISEKICKLLVWLTDENDGNKINSILSMVENKDPNHKIYKVILNNRNISLMDIDYNILPDDIYNLYTNDIYIKNYNILNNNGIFSCPSILNLIYERIYYLIKYSSKEEIKSSKNRGFLTEKIPKSLNYLMNIYYIMVKSNDNKTIFYNTIFNIFFQMYPMLQNESSYNQEQLINFLMERI